MLEKLDRQILEEYGFTNVELNESDNQWVITRNWFTGLSKVKTPRIIKISVANAPHKISETRQAPIIQFSVSGKSHPLPLGRFLYGWFFGVPEGMLVKYKDNNQFNNTLDNLKLCTWSEMIQDRQGSRNQYEAIKKNTIKNMITKLKDKYPNIEIDLASELVKED